MPAAEHTEGAAWPTDLASRPAGSSGSRGRSTAPRWWLNLQAHADATVDLADGSRSVTARAARPEERARLWKPLAGQFGDLDPYAALRSRETVVVILEPRRSA